MSQESIENYWEPSFDTFYDVYFLELACTTLGKRWERIDIATSSLVAITASERVNNFETLW